MGNNRLLSPLLPCFNLNPNPTIAVGIGVGGYPMCLAIPGKIVNVMNEDPVMRSGRVAFGGIIKEVNLSLVPDASTGDYVIVHVGIAISRLDEQEAERTFAYLEEMGELDELGERV